MVRAWGSIFGNGTKESRLGAFERCFEGKKSKRCHEGFSEYHVSLKASVDGTRVKRVSAKTLSTVATLQLIGEVDVSYFAERISLPWFVGLFVEDLGIFIGCTRDLPYDVGQ